MMLNRLILNVTKFQRPPPKRLGTVVKNILGGHDGPPMSNRVKASKFHMFLYSLWDTKQVLLISVPESMS